MGGRVRSFLTPTTVQCSNTPSLLTFSAHVVGHLSLVGEKKEKEAKVVRCYAFYISVVCAKGVFTVLEYEQNQTDMQITKTITGPEHGREANTFCVIRHMQKVLQ